MALGGGGVTATAGAEEIATADSASSQTAKTRGCEFRGSVYVRAECH